MHLLFHVKHSFLTKILRSVSCETIFAVKHPKIARFAPVFARFGENLVIFLKNWKDLLPITCKSE